jgi:hypothetical protein
MVNKFYKTGQDEYKISGENKRGSDFLKIEGTARMTSPKILNSTEPLHKVFQIMMRGNWI